MSEIYPEQVPARTPGQAASPADVLASLPRQWEAEASATRNIDYARALRDCAGELGGVLARLATAPGSCEHGDECEEHHQLDAQLAMAQDAISGLASERDKARAEAEYWQNTASDLGEKMTTAHAERDKAYRERARLVAFLAGCYPSSMLTDSADPDWPIVFAETPAGQLSWHIARADLELFAHVPETTEPTWDGRTTEAKYERLAELTRKRAVAEPVAVVASRDSVAPEIAMAAPEQAPDPFGGHEFHYEAHTDLFRCIRCHAYEVSVRTEDGITRCPGQPPEGSGPIEVNML